MTSNITRRYDFIVLSTSDNYHKARYSVRSHWGLKSYIDSLSRENMRDANYCESQLSLVFELIWTWFELVSLCSRVFSMIVNKIAFSLFINYFDDFDDWFVLLLIAFISQYEQWDCHLFARFVHLFMFCFKSLSCLNSEITIYVLDLLSFENYVNWLLCVFFQCHFICFIVLLSFREIFKLI